MARTSMDAASSHDAKKSRARCEGVTLEHFPKKYAHLSDAILPITRLVSLLRKNPTAELEARLGTINDDGSFSVGVERSDIDRIVRMMQNSPYMTGDDEW